METSSKPNVSDAESAGTEAVLRQMQLHGIQQQLNIFHTLPYYREG